MFVEAWMGSDGLGYLFVALLVGLLLALGLGRPRRRPVPPAEEILKKRYASGQLSRREYRRQLDELRR